MRLKPPSPGHVYYRVTFHGPTADPIARLMGSTPAMYFEAPMDEDAEAMTDEMNRAIASPDGTTARIEVVADLYVDPLGRYVEVES